MDTNPSLQGALLLETQIELVSSTAAAGTLYGVAIVLYCLYLHASHLQPPGQGRRRRAQFMIPCSTIIMICGFYYLVSNAWVIQDAYIRHTNFPGGPFVYESSTFHTQPVIAVGIVCQLIVDILTAAVQIWRLWVVWSGTRYARLVIILPMLSLLGSTALQIRMIVFDTTLPDATVMGSQAINLGTAEFALRATTIILPTVLIAGFLTFESRRQVKLIGQFQGSNLYLGVVAMLVESYALESGWTIVFVILFSVGHPVAQFFSDTLTYIEIVAYLLVLYRVTNGRIDGSQGARASSSSRENVSSLRWNRTTMRSRTTSVTDVNTHLSGNQPELHTGQRQGSLV